MSHVLGLTECKVYKFCWDLKNSEARDNSTALQQQILGQSKQQNEFELVAKQMGIDVDALADELVGLPSPRGTRQVFKITPLMGDE